MVTQQLKEITRFLAANGKQADAAFFAKMVPGKQRIYGVKTPILNDLARKYRDGSFALAEALWKAGAQEQRIIAIKIMEKKGKEDPDRLLKLFKQFSRSIDNWAVCDGLGMQFLRGIVKTHRDEIFKIAKTFVKSPDEWQRRLSLVMVEWYTRHSADHADIKALVSALEKDQAYYVKKAVVWINRNFRKGK